MPDNPGRRRAGGVGFAFECQAGHHPSVGPASGVPDDSDAAVA
jgi:hypothetical protein